MKQNKTKQKQLDGATKGTETKFHNLQVNGSLPSFPICNTYYYNYYPSHSSHTLFLLFFSYSSCWLLFFKILGCVSFSRFSSTRVNKRRKKKA
jgi:hypothetical protein